MKGIKKEGTKRPKWVVTFKMFIIITIWWHKINICADYEHIVFKDSSHVRHSVDATDVADADYDDYDYDMRIVMLLLLMIMMKFFTTLQKNITQYQTVTNMFKINFILFSIDILYVSDQIKRT